MNEFLMKISNISQKYAIIIQHKRLEISFNITHNKHTIENPQKQI